MDDVGMRDEEAARRAGAEQPDAADAERAAADQAGRQGIGANSAATRRPKARTAAEIVADQRAAERRAAEQAARRKPEATTNRPPEQPASSGTPDSGAAENATANRAPVDRVAAGRETPNKAAPNKTAAGKTAAGKTTASRATTSTLDARTRQGVGAGRARAAESGLDRARSAIASLVWLVAVLTAGLLALGCLFTALEQVNQDNSIVTWVLARGNELVGPFGDLLRLETAKNTLLVNWGLAALVYLVLGKVVQRFVRP